VLVLGTLPGKVNRHEYGHKIVLVNAKLFCLVENTRVCTWTKTYSQTMLVVSVADSLKAIGHDGRVILADLDKVEVAVSDPPQRELAVASWRWDLVDNHSVANIGRLLKQCVKYNIKYLAIDCISVSQSEDKNELMGNLVQFSSLYSKARLVFSYNTALDGKNGASDMQRAWILSEVQIYAKLHVCGNYLRYDNPMGMYHPFALADHFDYMEMMNISSDELPALLQLLDIVKSLYSDVAFALGFQLVAFALTFPLYFLTETWILIRTGRFYENDRYKTVEKQEHANSVHAATSKKIESFIGKMGPVGRRVSLIPTYICGLNFLWLYYLRSLRLAPPQHHYISVLLEKAALEEYPAMYFGDLLHIAANNARESVFNTPYYEGVKDSLDLLAYFTNRTWAQVMSSGHYTCDSCRLRAIVALTVAGGAMASDKVLGRSIEVSLIPDDVIRVANVMYENRDDKHIAFGMRRLKWRQTAKDSNSKTKRTWLELKTKIGLDFIGIPATVTLMGEGSDDKVKLTLDGASNQGCLADWRGVVDNVVAGLKSCQCNFQLGPAAV